MAIQIADGFQLRVAKPLDDRQNVETVAQLDPTYGYEGQIVYVKDIKQFYTCYKDENGSLGYKVMETGSSTSNESAGIELWVSGKSYEENDYVIYNDYIYRCLNSNNTIDFGEANWEQLTYGIDELSKEDVERLLGLTKEEIEAMADLILDTEVRIDKTYSSSKIYQDIQQCLNDSKTFTLLELGKFSGVSYKIVASTSEMTSESIIYLLANGNTYDMYIVEESGATTKIGDMDVNLDNYFTKAEIDNDFLKKVDVDGKYATITTVDGKVDKTDIVDDLTSTDTDKPLSANQGKVLKDELDLKANASEVVKKNTICIDIMEGTNVDQTVIDKYGTEILKYPLGIWRISSDNIANNFTDLPVKTSGLIEITSINPDTNKNPWNSSWSYRVYNFETYTGNNYFRKVTSSFTPSILDNDKGWQKVCATTVDDVGVTTITPVNSNITGNIEYTVKNGICYVSMNDLMSTISSTKLLISDTMPKPSINCATLSVDASGSITRIYIGKNTTNLYGNFYTKNAKGNCSFSYPVAE